MNTKQIIIDMYNIFFPYVGVEKKDLMTNFNCATNSKNVNEILIHKILAQYYGEEFNRSFFHDNMIIPKYIRINPNYYLKESISFPSFKYTDIVNETWENSTLRNTFANYEFVFFVFQIIDQENEIFKGLYNWQMPKGILDGEVANVWKMVVETIRLGRIVKEYDFKSKKIIRTNFPGLSTTKFVHVRPHARNSDDVIALPVIDTVSGLNEFTKYSFWLNSKYISSIIYQGLDNTPTNQSLITIEEESRNNYVINSDNLNELSDLELIEHTLKENCINKPIKLIILKNIVKTYRESAIENITLHLKELEKNGVIEFTNYGIKYNYISIVEAINLISDDNIKVLILNRLSGQPLNYLSNNIKINDIKKDIIKVYEKIGIVKEDKYKYFYCKYYFTEQLFCKIFDTDSAAYYYLHDKYEYGNLPIKNIIDEDCFNEEEKERINQILGFNVDKIIVDKREIGLNQVDIASYILERYFKHYNTIESFIKQYESFVETRCPKNKTLSINNKNINGLLLKTKKCIIIEDNIRYYDLLGLTSETIQNIGEHFINSIGYFSIELFFKRNRTFYKNIDIRNSQELFEIYRYISFLKPINVVFINPNLLLNYDSKYKFYKDIIAQNSPIEIDVLVKTIEQDYGVDINHSKTYIQREFNLYFNRNNILEIQTSKSVSEIYQTLEGLYQENMYTREEFVKAAINKDNSIKEKDVTNGIVLNKLGYKMKNGIIIRKKYSSIEKCLEQLILSKDYYQVGKSYGFTNYNSVISRLESKCYIIRLSNSEYITLKKLNEIGVKTEQILSLRNEIHDFYFTGDFFTVDNVKELFDIEFIDEYGFEDIFLSSLISSIKGIRSVSIYNKRIFCKTTKNVTRFDFISTIVETQNSISIDEIIETIYNKYYLEFNFDEIRDLVRNTDYYYDIVMEKVYIDKKYYYDEVYDE